MYDANKLADRFALEHDAVAHRRLIAGAEVILHCHHYNSRLQNTVEGASQIDGKAIIVRAAEAAFVAQITAACRPGDDADSRWAVAQHLYAHLGYGWFERTPEGITATAAHFVEGWNAGFGGRSTPVCTFTEGYLQAAIHAATGDLVHVVERTCMITGAPACTFEIVPNRIEPLATHAKQPVRFAPRPLPALPASSIDAQAIVDALVAMPIHGNTEGLIPAFGVYLASTPADFYNRVCIDFVDGMTEIGLGRQARKLLIHDAETGGMNTFRGIMSSPEWEGLVAPMVKVPDDNLFGIVAVSNALGWGNWHVTSHQSGVAARIESFQGYEALGYREHRGIAHEMECLMLTGVAAGIMELVYSKGSIDERFGTFQSVEQQCIAMAQGTCVFAVEQT